MSKQVRCISPHGGCRNGRWRNGDPVHALPDGTVPRPDPATLALPPNPGGYVADGRIAGGLAAVGQVYDVPDDFYADGFHWEELGGGATELPAAADAPAPWLSLTIPPDTAPDNDGPQTASAQAGAGAGADTTTGSGE